MNTANTHNTHPITTQLWCIYLSHIKRKEQRSCIHFSSLHDRGVVYLPLEECAQLACVKGAWQTVEWVEWICKWFVTYPSCSLKKQWSSIYLHSFGWVSKSGIDLPPPPLVYIYIYETLLFLPCSLVPIMSGATAGHIRGVQVWRQWVTYGAFFGDRHFGGAQTLFSVLSNKQIYNNKQNAVIWHWFGYNFCSTICTCCNYNCIYSKTNCAGPSCSFSQGNSQDCINPKGMICYKWVHHQHVCKRVIYMCVDEQAWGAIRRELPLHSQNFNPKGMLWMINWVHQYVCEGSYTCGWAGLRQ